MAVLPVFADVDTGIDDALALIYLLASPDAEVIGIAATGGNVGVDQVCRNNLALLALCGVTGVGVSRGADAPLRGPAPTTDNSDNNHGPHGLGYAELSQHGGVLTGDDGAAAWIAAAHEQRGRLVGVVTGPLTNLALALRAEPRLPTLLRRLVIMGGSFGDDDHPANPVTSAEFNVRTDPEAAAQVLSAWAATQPDRLPILCGLQLTRRVVLTPAVLARLAVRAGSARQPSGVATNPLIRFLQDATRFSFEAHRRRYGPAGGDRAYLHDPLAAAVALDPALVALRPAAVRVDLTHTRGRTVADWTGPPNARIGVDVDPAAVIGRFVERVAILARRCN